MFVDPDDYLRTEAVELLYERIIQDGSDMAVGRHVDVYDDGRENGSYCSWMKDSVVKTEEALSFMNTPNFIAVCPWAKLYKREIFEKIRYSSIKCAEDLMLYPEILDQCEQISIVNECIYYYFQRDDSLMRQKSEQGKLDELQALMLFSKYLKNKKVYSGARRWYLRSINQIYTLQNRKTGLTVLKETFNVSEERELLRGIGLKQRIKRLLLCFPILFDAYTWVKKQLSKNDSLYFV
jgi:hypothetical protein